jgi:hypothetical protein
MMSATHLLTILASIAALHAVACSDDGTEPNDGGGGTTADGGADGSGGDVATTPSELCQAIDALDAPCSLPWEPATTCEAAEMCWQGILREELLDSWHDCLLVYPCDPQGCEDSIAKEIADVEQPEALWNIRITCTNRQASDCAAFPEVDVLCERFKNYDMNAGKPELFESLLPCWDLACDTIVDCVEPKLDVPQQACGWTLL